MKRLFLIAGLLWGIQTQAQLAVTAPVLETTTILNHVEQMQQAVQSYQTMVNVQAGIDKGIDAVEKVNNKLTTIRDVQEIANRSALCVKRIQKTFQMVSDMKLDVPSTTSLLSACNQCTRDCMNLSAYGAKIFTNNFLKMSDKERLDETRRLLDDMDTLLAKVGYINTQAKAIKFNNEMINAYYL